MWDVACYIHLNPVRAGLVEDPAEWEFSNFANYVEGGNLQPVLWKGSEYGRTLKVSFLRCKSAMKETFIQAQWLKGAL